MQEPESKRAPRTSRRRGAVRAPPGWRKELAAAEGRLATLVESKIGEVGAQVIAVSAQVRGEVALRQERERIEHERLLVEQARKDLTEEIAAKQDAEREERDRIRAENKRAIAERDRLVFGVLGALLVAIVGSLLTKLVPSDQLQGAIVLTLAAVLVSGAMIYLLLRLRGHLKGRTNGNGHT